MRRKMHVENKPKNAFKTLARMYKYMSGHTIGLVFAIILIIFSSLAGIIGTSLLRPLINNLMNNIKLLMDAGHDANTAKEIIMSGVFDTLVIMIVVYVLGALSTYFGNRLLLIISQKTTNRIRKELFDHLQSLPVGFFDRNTHGELMSRFTNDMEHITMALEQSLSQTITSAITIVGTFIMMVYYSPFLTIFVILMLFVMLRVVKIVGKKSAVNFRNQQKSLGELNGFIEEMMEGQKVVKIFNHEEKNQSEFEALNEELRKASTDAQTYAGILMPIMGNLSYVQYAITACVGALLIANPVNLAFFAMDVGTLASFLQFTRAFSQPITQIANQTNTLLAAIAGAERIFSVLDEEPEEDNGKTTLAVAKRNENNELVHVDKPFVDMTQCQKENLIPVWKTPTPDGYKLTELKGDVRFNNVVFGYVEDVIVLKNLSLYAKPGQKIAFVGSTGAGKTTVTNLLNRFYEIKEGTITYDGIDIRDIKKADLRRTLGFVLQDVHLFEGTIKDNIRYGRLDASDEEVVQSAKIANAHSFIKRLPQGYDTILTKDGINLSQGQKQLVSIARAAISDPPVLVLDEATSSIDTRTEKLIEKGMDTLMKDRTTFVIAHRLSTVRNANAIMVIENGEIIERGDHEDLLDLKGRYYNLYTGMSELS